MEQENAFAKPNFPPLIMYVCTHRVHSIAYNVPQLQRKVSHFCGLEKPSYLHIWSVSSGGKCLISESIALISSGETLHKRTSSFHTLSKANTCNYLLTPIYNCRRTKLFISQKNHRNCKNILNYRHKNVSFAWLNGWNVTKTGFDHA